MTSDEKKNQKYSGFYEELADVIGDEKIMQVYENFRGLEITLPTRLYSADYVVDLAMKNKKKSIKDIARKYGYNERYLRRLIHAKTEIE